MAVEFKDYAVIVEGPMDQERGEAVIAERAGSFRTSRSGLS
jgi:hypothetical protein